MLGRGDFWEGTMIKCPKSRRKRVKRNVIETDNKEKLRIYWEGRLV